MRRLRYRMLLRAFLLLFSLVAVIYLFFRGEHLYAMLIVPVCLWFLLGNYRLQQRIYRELEEFAEAAKYHDFTRTFRVEKSAAELKPLHRAFNDINAIFRKISVDREIQYQYLQQLLDIVDTAILSYDAASGKVVWINDAFRKLFGIPYLHAIDGLKKRNQELHHHTVSISTGAPSLYTLSVVSGRLKLLLYARDFQTSEGSYRLIAYQNVNETIDETEAKAWKKLLSVLTHEIMNSIAPISSLADTLKNRLLQLPQTDELEDIRLGAQTIKRRSESLLKFAGTYRSLNKIEHPNITRVQVAEMFENLYQLMEPTLIQKGIELDIILADTQLQLDLDVDLIEQVLINLLLNAIEAVQHLEKPYIRLSAVSHNGVNQIKVTDNGRGIPPDLLENIFIPFFTTRKSGSGVGLTLSKQIMLLHKGNILVESEEGKGSVFTLQF